MNASHKLSLIASLLAWGEVQPDQQRAMAEKLSAVAVQVRRLEVMLDEIVADAMDDEQMRAMAPRAVVVRFPAERRT